MEQRSASGSIYNCSIRLAEPNFRICYHICWIQEVESYSLGVGDAKSNSGEEIEAWARSADLGLPALQSFHLPLLCFSLAFVSSLELWFLVFTDNLCTHKKFVSLERNLWNLKYVHCWKEAKCLVPDAISAFFILQGFCILSHMMWQYASFQFWSWRILINCPFYEILYSSA